MLKVDPSLAMDRSNVDASARKYESYSINIYKSRINNNLIIYFHEKSIMLQGQGHLMK